jgi:hypothetical protein
MDPASSSSSGHQHIRTTPVLSSREEAINAWAATITLDSVQLNEESSDIVAINGLLRHLLTQKHLRRFCVMFTISGYKNKKREETIQLIVRRMRSEAIEKILYSDGEDSDISREQQQANSQPPALSENIPVTEQQQCFSSSSSIASENIECIGAPSADNSSPTTRSMSRRAATVATTKNKANKKKRSKSTPPLICDTGGNLLSSNQCIF